MQSAVTLREIKRYQKSAEFLMQKTFFRRIVREIMKELKEFKRIQEIIINAMQKTTEAMLISTFESI